MEIVLSHILKFNSAYGFYMLFFWILLIVALAVGRKFWSGLLLIPFVIVNYIYSDTMNHNYLRKHGQSGRGVVTAVEPTDVWVNDVRQMRLKTILKDGNGQTVKTDFTTNEGIYDTKLDMTQLPGPNIGEEFAVLFMPGHMENFSILPEDQSTPYGKRIVCTEIAGRMQSASAAYNFTPNDEGAKAAYLQVQQELQKNGCF